MRGSPTPKINAKRFQAISTLSRPTAERPESQDGAQHHYDTAYPDPNHQRPHQHLDRGLSRPHIAGPGKDQVQIFPPAHPEDSAPDRRLLSREELESRAQHSEVVLVVENPEGRLHPRVGRSLLHLQALEA